MVSIGARALGVGGFRERLAYLGLHGATETDLVGELLTTCYQASANSSQATRESARTIATALGGLEGRHYELDLRPIISGVRDLAGIVDVFASLDRGHGVKFAILPEASGWA